MSVVFDPGSHAAEGKEHIPFGFVLQGPGEGDGQERETELTCALPQSPGQWGCEHGTVWRGQILLYGIWEYKLPSWPARESAEWWGNLNWNKV